MIISTHLSCATAHAKRNSLWLLTSALLCFSGSIHAALPGTSAAPVIAAPSGAPSAAAPIGAAPVEPSFGYTRSLKQLGKRDPMNLHGVESTDSVNFDIRADQVVTGAQIALQYSYSPALLADLSQINVLVNGEVAASLALPKDGAGKLQQQTLQIPALLITEFNQLSLQFIGHYTMQCEDPLHTSLWANISNESQLSLEISAIALANDLALLPAPLFDRRDSQPLNLPFVFAAAPDNAALEAAGTLSSWFGALASYRGAAFPASFGALPAKGNAVVFVSDTDGSRPTGLPIASAAGPTLTLISNPNDPRGKLLIVSGRNSAELKQAAAALALGSSAFSGASVVIEHLGSLKPRSPYDAPNWIPSNRPVRLGELATTKQLSISGYNSGSMTVPMRLPPDLFNWREQGAELNLKYRYTPQTEAAVSSLLVSFNDTLIKSIDLPRVDKPSATTSVLLALKNGDNLASEASMLLPLNSVALQSRLQFRFMYDISKQGECHDIIIDKMRGVIDPDSTLNLSNYDHYIAMPNLGVFKDSGFPFTRMADLSETAVILPNDAGAAEITAYLTLLGRFGESTGYPATGVSVTQADQVAAQANKDLLVLASGINQPLLKQWEKLLPAKTEGKSQYVELSDLPLRLRNWISPDPAANQRESRASLKFSGDGSSSYLTGFESPLKNGRSVVFMSSAQPAGLAEVTRALTNNADEGQAIQGSLVIIQGTRVESLVADQAYYVGHLGWFKHLQWLMSQNLIWLMVLTPVCLLLVSALAYLSLRARTQRRLGN